MENQRLLATVERIVFFNPENGYAVVRVRVAGARDLVTVVGKLSELHPGEVLALQGQWIDDPRHGRQFQASAMQVQRPADVNGLLRYLGGGLVVGLGPVLARRIVDYFGDQVLDILDGNPARVQEVPGIGAARARALAAAWARQRGIRQVMEWLRERGVSTLYAARIYEAYGDEAPAVLSANPYRLALELPGFGFVAADQLGRAIGVRPDAPVRVQAGVESCLRRAADDGDCYLPYGELCLGAAMATGVSRAAVEAALAQLAAAGRVFGIAPPAASAPPASQTSASGRRRLSLYAPAAAAVTPETPIYLATFEHAEAGLARHLARLAGTAPKGLPPVDRWLKSYEGRQGIELAAEQRQAVQHSAARGLLVLTGGPGTGKTTTLRAIHQLLSAGGRSIVLAAPTGKAARRLAEVTGATASTVHRLLGRGRDNQQGFAHDENDPLPFDTVIVDEASMLDLFLAYSLVRAVRPGAQLVLVGDADQLPSVGPGQVLRDLLAADIGAVVRLGHVFRQAAASRIVTAAHEVREGVVPEIPAPGAGGDLWLVEARRGQAGALALQWAVEQLPHRLDLAPSDVQVLSPQLRGEAGTETLNARLQARLNPARAGRPDWFRGALSLREGDRVIHTANNYRLGVFNGETGLVQQIDPLAQTLSVDFGDREVTYSPAEIVELQHAYALTVHRAQGSEWPAVVVVLSTEHTRMLARNLLYTALTRGRRAVVLVAEAGTLAVAVADDRAFARRTGLARRLAEAG